jgi:GT2 family glycosyltransferase
VVIVAYQNAATIDECLHSVLSSNAVSSAVVVDHGTDNSGDIAERLGATVVRDPANPGFATGQNRGCALGSAPVILLLNPDAVMEPDAIACGLKAMDQNSFVAAVQGVIIDESTGNPERSSGRLLAPIHLWGRALGLRRLLRFEPIRAAARRLPALSDHVDRSPSDPIQVESLSATALLIRRSALEGVGGFDERFFLYGEDIDLCRRLRLEGWQLFALPRIWARHRWGSSTSDLIKREVLWWQGAMTYAARWYRRRAWVSAFAACTLRAVTLVARRPRLTPEILSSLIVDVSRKKYLMRTDANDDYSNERL